MVHQSQFMKKIVEQYAKDTEGAEEKEKDLSHRSSRKILQHFSLYSPFRRW